MRAEKQVFVGASAAAPTSLFFGISLYAGFSLSRYLYTTYALAMEKARK